MGDADQSEARNQIGSIISISCCVKTLVNYPELLTKSILTDHG